MTDIPCTQLEDGRTMVGQIRKLAEGVEIDVMVAGTPENFVGLSTLKREGYPPVEGLADSRALDQATSDGVAARIGRQLLLECKLHAPSV